MAGMNVRAVDDLLEKEKDDHLPHLDESTWFIRTDRAGAISQLTGAPDGSFLIRPKDDNYVLSIV